MVQICIAVNLLRGQSSCSSWSVVLVVVVVSRRGQLFFVVSRSSWSVFLVVVYGWGKPRSMTGQMYGGIIRVGGHR